MQAKTKEPTPDLQWYGLKAFGFGPESLPLTGERTHDQLLIEGLAFRISHARHEGGLDRHGHFKEIVSLLWNNPESGSFKQYKWGPWGERMIREMCEEPELGVAGCGNAGKSDPASLYALVSYLTDPTHTLVIVMSTSIKEAKKRIWKTLLEYWEGIKNLPGKYMKSSNEILGLSYDGESFGQSSGIILMAGEQAKESESINRLIGIKPPKTGDPAETYEQIILKGEFADLVEKFDEETLRDLLPRLNNLSHNRTGKLIIVLDEMTGISSAVLDAIVSNLKFANRGHIQIVGLANPDRVYDCFGIFCTPKDGWESVDLENDDEWETRGGGKCIRFDAEKSPRVTEPDGDKYHWLPSKAAIDKMAEGGRKSRYFLRMVKAMWTLDAGENGIYAPADVELSGARQEKVVWGLVPPVPASFLDPAFTAGGDKAMATFGLVGEDIHGEKVFLREDSVNIPVDVTDERVPINFQLVRNWKRECQARGVLPQNAAYDRTGGGISFGDIVYTQWSPLVTGITSAGPASKTPIPGEFKPAGRPGQKPEPVLACERFANRATEIWYSAQPLFRSGQIFGVSAELAKELCSRQSCKKAGAKEKVEEKAVFRSREGKSPDESDSFLGLIDFARKRFGLLPTEKVKARIEQGATEIARNVIHTLRERARRITNKRSLKRG